MHVAGAEGDRRVDADERQPLGRQPHRLDLGLVNRVHVGDAEARRGEELGLVRRRAGWRGPEGRGARGVDDPLHALAQRLLEHDLGAVHVHVEQPLGVLGAHGGHAGGVEHPVDPPQRLADARSRSSTSQVTRSQSSPSSSSSGESSRTVTRSSSPRLTRAARQVGADEAGRAGEERLRHRFGYARVVWRWLPSKWRWQSMQSTASGMASSRVLGNLAPAAPARAVAAVARARGAPPRSAAPPPRGRSRWSRRPRGRGSRWPRRRGAGRDGRAPSRSRPECIAARDCDELREPGVEPALDPLPLLRVHYRTG